LEHFPTGELSPAARRRAPRRTARPARAFLRPRRHTPRHGLPRPGRPDLGAAVIGPGVRAEV